MPTHWLPASLRWGSARAITWACCCRTAGSSCCCCSPPRAPERCWCRKAWAWAARRCAARSAPPGYGMSSPGRPPAAARTAADALPAQAARVSVGARLPGWTALEDLLALDAPATAPPALAADHPYLMVLTSGSTGAPKPILLSQHTKHMRAVSAIELYSVTDADVTLACTPAVPLAGPAAGADPPAHRRHQRADGALHAARLGGDGAQSRGQFLDRCVLAVATAAGAVRPRAAAAGFAALSGVVVGAARHGDQDRAVRAPALRVPRVLRHLRDRDRH